MKGTKIGITIKGSEIDNLICPFPGRYVSAWVEGYPIYQEYRIDLNLILELIKNVEFDVVKKTSYEHLVLKEK